MHQRTDSALIVGCVRDAEEALKIVLPNLVEISRMFRDQAICIYENDSKDGTLAALRQFPEIEVISETDVPGTRTVRLARGRNVLLDKARTEYAHFDWLIVMDLDYYEPAAPRSIDRALNTWEEHRWNGCTANSRLYYDYWALRHSSFERDCVKNPPCPYDWIPTDEITKVRSAFNGIGIYKMSRVVETSCSYEGTTPDGRIVCEHVSFNTCLDKIIIYKHLQATTWNETVGRRRLLHLTFRYKYYIAGLLLFILISVLAYVAIILV